MSKKIATGSGDMFLQFLIQERENFEQVVSFRKAVKNPV